MPFSTAFYIYLIAELNYGLYIVSHAQDKNLAVNMHVTLGLSFPVINLLFTLDDLIWNVDATQCKWMSISHKYVS